MVRQALLILATALPLQAAAASLNKCVDENGQVTFTQLACSQGRAGERIDIASGNQGMTMGPPRTESAAQATRPEQAEGRTRAPTLTVVGGKDGAACSDASDTEIRSAIVRNEVFVGMTAEQAVKSWGKPHKINSSSHGSDQWVYYRGGYDADYLYIDESGCVKAWN